MNKIFLISLSFFFSTAANIDAVRVKKTNSQKSEFELGEREALVSKREALVNKIKIYEDSINNINKLRKDAVNELKDIDKKLWIDDESSSDEESSSDDESSSDEESSLYEESSIDDSRVIDTKEINEIKDLIQQNYDKLLEKKEFYTIKENFTVKDSSIKIQPLFKGDNTVTKIINQINRLGPRTGGCFSGCGSLIKKSKNKKVNLRYIYNLAYRDIPNKYYKNNTNKFTLEDYAKHIAVELVENNVFYKISDEKKDSMGFPMLPR